MGFFFHHHPTITVYSAFKWETQGRLAGPDGDSGTATGGGHRVVEDVSEAAGQSRRTLGGAARRAPDPDQHRAAGERV